jgi:MFS family permease
VLIVQGARKTENAQRMALMGWLAASLFYFYQYLLRSAPSVMMPQLGDTFALTAVQLASLVGFFNFGYAPFSLVAGVTIDRAGPRTILAVAAAMVGIGALLFSLGDPGMARAGRFLQGAGGVFSFVGAVYIAAHYFPASLGATLVGITQMFGMAGGSAGQFLVGMAITGGLTWNEFWAAASVAGIGIAGLLFAFVPGSPSTQTATPRKGQALAALMTVARNPQSILCGVIAGLLFIPTTVFDMVWGVRFLQESHNVSYAAAVMRTASVPLGWIIGCPLLGVLSDRIGLRKPAMIGGAALLLVSLFLILWSPASLFPPFSLGLLAGIGSGAAMIPYTVIKEVNRPEHSGTTAGVLNFINFSISALLGPVFAAALMRASGGGVPTHAHYQAAFAPILYGVMTAMILVFLLKETGPRRRAEITPDVPSSPPGFSKGA